MADEKGTNTAGRAAALFILPLRPTQAASL